MFDYKQKGFTSFSGRTANAWFPLAKLISPVFSHSFEAGLYFRIVFTYPPTTHPPNVNIIIFDCCYIIIINIILYIGCSLLADTCSSVHKMVIFLALRFEIMDLETAHIHLHIHLISKVFRYNSISRLGV